MDILELLKYIFLGFVQGITEVLPISSSGHVAIFQHLLKIGTDDSAIFFALVNFGSLLAVIWYFRATIGRLIVNFFRYIFVKGTRAQSANDFFYFLKIIIGIIPAGLVGLFLKKYIDDAYLKYGLVMVGFGLLVTSTFLFIVRNAPESNVRQNLTFKDAAIIGLLQPFAIIPGLSRSGITVAGGLMKKLSLETALTFSFLMYVLISIGYAGESFYSAYNAESGFGLSSLGFSQYIYYACSFFFAFLGTKIGLKYIFKWFRQGKLVIFAYYTMALGLVSLLAGVFTF